MPAITQELRSDVESCLTVSEDPKDKSGRRKLKDRDGDSTVSHSSRKSSVQVSLSPFHRHHVRFERLKRLRTSLDTL